MPYLAFETLPIDGRLFVSRSVDGRKRKEMNRCSNDCMQGIEGGGVRPKSMNRDTGQITMQG